MAMKNLTPAVVHTLFANGADKIAALQDEVIALCKERAENLMMWGALLQSQGGTVRIPERDLVTVPSNATIERRYGDGYVTYVLLPPKTKEAT